MKTTRLFLLFALFAGTAHASDELLSEYTEGSLRDQLYVVDSSEFDPDESLNRISGHIDTGFSNADSSYHSASHNLASPFAGATYNDNADGAE